MAWIHLGQHRDNRSAQVNMVMKFPASQTARNLLEQLSDDQFLKDFCPRGCLFLMILSQCQRVRHSYSVFPMQSFYVHLLPLHTFLYVWKKSAVFQNSRRFIKATYEEIRQAEEPSKCSLFHNWAINFCNQPRVIFIVTIRNLSNDRFKASSKTIPPHNAI